MSSKVKEPPASYGTPPSFEKVWLMFQETNKQFKETKEIFKKRDAENDKRFKETKEILKKRAIENDKRADKTDKRIKELNNLFTSQWGKLIESLVEGDLIHLLNEKGVLVKETMERVKGNHEGTSFEFDIIAINGKEIVVVEVKTTLRPNDVEHFISKLKNVKLWLEYFSDKTVYGAMAYLRADAGSNRMAENKGLFTIKATGSSASVGNRKDFVPRTF